MEVIAPGKRVRYHGFVSSVTFLAHAGPVTLVLLSKRALAAVGLVAVIAVFPVSSPAVHLEHDFVVMTVTIT